jgi:hypothetical protein
LASGGVFDSFGAVRNRPAKIVPWIALLSVASSSMAGCPEQVPRDSSPATEDAPARVETSPSPAGAPRPATPPAIPDHARATPAHAAAAETDRVWPTFHDESVDVATLRRALAQVPELARFAEAFTLFEEADVGGVFVRGHAEAVLPEGVRKVSGVLEWSPKAGEHVWVFAGRAGHDSLVAVIRPSEDGAFQHVASMILEDDPLSVLLHYAPGTARSIGWTTCYGCDGEGGEIQFRDDGRIVVVQR